MENKTLTHALILQKRTTLLKGKTYLTHKKVTQITQKYLA